MDQNMEILITALESLEDEYALNQPYKGNYDWVVPKEHHVFTLLNPSNFLKMKDTHRKKNCSKSFMNKFLCLVIFENLIGSTKKII